MTLACTASAAALLALAACSSSPAGHQPNDSSSASKPNSSSVWSTSAPPTPTTSSATPLPTGVLAAMDVPSNSAPTEMIAAGGAIWVEAHRGLTVSRIDPATDKVTAHVSIGVNSCGLPVAIKGEVWVGPCGDSSSTTVIDTATATVKGTVADAGFQSMAAADGSVWVPSYAGTKVLRVNPATLKVVVTITIPSGVVLYGAGRVWTFGVNEDSQNTTGRVAEIDPHTNRVVARFSLPQALHDPYGVFAYGAIWLKSDDNANLYRLDPTTHRVTSTPLTGWATLSDYTDQVVEAGNGSLWIRNNDGHVARIDPATRRVTATYPADPDGSGGSPLVAYGSLWVSNFDADVVWRDRLTG